MGIMGEVRGEEGKGVEKNIQHNKKKKKKKRILRHLKTKK